MSTTHLLPDSPPAEAWLAEYAAAVPVLQELTRSAPPAWPLRVQRSSQLDAARLDNELLAMLQEQMNAIFARFRPGATSGMEPELELLLSALIFWLSVWRGRATPGSELMNLRYRDERSMKQQATAGSRAASSAANCASSSSSSSSSSLSSGAAAAPPPETPTWLHGGRSGIEGPGLSQAQRVGYGLLTVALPYAWARLHTLTAAHAWRGSSAESGGDTFGDASEATTAGRGAWAVLRALAATHSAAALLNSWVFLVQGEYRSITERLLGARLVYRSASVSRVISFEYLNRQLVWQELSELLLFLLPLVNVAALRRAALRLLPRSVVLSGAGSASSACAVRAPSKAEVAAAEVAAAAAAKPTPCPLCGATRANLPCVAWPCRHVFCYYCLAAHCAADACFACPLDGQRVESLQRYLPSYPCRSPGGESSRPPPD